MRYGMKHVMSSLISMTLKKSKQPPQGCLARLFFLRFWDALTCWDRQSIDSVTDSAVLLCASLIAVLPSYLLTAVSNTCADNAKPLQIDKVARWGDLESDEEESSEEEESEDEDEEAAGRDDDEASLADGLTSVGGVSSLPSGLETPEVIDLRKAKAGGVLPLFSFSSLVMI